MMKTKSERVYTYNRTYVKGISATKLKMLIDGYEKKYGVNYLKQILEDAKRKKHPLHNYFEWDDKICGVKYRLEQLRQLIRSIQLIEVDKNIKVRAFSNIMFDKAGEITLNPYKTESSFYINTDEALLNENYAFAVLQQARNQLKSHIDKLTQLNLFKDIVLKMDDVVKDMDKEMFKRKSDRIN